MTPFLHAEVLGGTGLISAIRPSLILSVHR